MTEEKRIFLKYMIHSIFMGKLHIYYGRSPIRTDRQNLTRFKHELSLLCEHFKASRRRGGAYFKSNHLSKIQIRFTQKNTNVVCITVTMSPLLSFLPQTG